MTKRTFKQIVVVLSFLTIISGVSFIIYYVKIPNPSCFDGILNQKEEEIDCGGSCISCELVHIQDLEVLWVQVLANRSNYYDVIARIKNPNLNYGSGRIPYQLRLYDSQDNLITEYSDFTFVLPNQTKYLLQTRVKSTNRITKAVFSFSDIEWEKPDEYQPSQLVIQHKSYRLLGENEGGFSQATAILVNRTNFDFEKIDIDVLLFDSFHNLTGTNKTQIRTLLTGEERDFVVTWFDEIDGYVASVEMEAETNIFDSGNYLPASSESEQFQEY